MSSWNPRGPKRRQGHVGRGKHMDVLARALGLLVALASKRFGMDMAEIKDELGVGRRAVYHYLDALARAGVEFDNRVQLSPGGRRQRLIRLKNIQGFTLTRLSPGGCSAGQG